MRRLKNTERGKNASGRGDYSRKEEGERLKTVGIGRGTPLTIDLATENETGIQDGIPLLGYPQCETDLARLLREDTSGVGLVPVSIVETIIAVGHSGRHFVFEVSYHAYTSHPINKHCIFSYLSYRYIWLTQITGDRFTGKENEMTRVFRPARARSVECCIKGSSDDLRWAPRIYGYQEYQRRGAAGLKLVPPVAVRKDE